MIKESIKQEIEEVKLHLLGQVMDQIRFVHGRKAVTGDTFDWLHDMTILQLQAKQNEYERKVREKADPKLREARELIIKIEDLKTTISMFNATNDTAIITGLLKHRDVLIARYKELTGRYSYP